MASSSVSREEHEAVVASKLVTTQRILEDLVRSRAQDQHFLKQEQSIDEAQELADDIQRVRSGACSWSYIHAFSSGLTITKKSTHYGDQLFTSFIDL
jgi:hypothetical protein